MDRQPSNVISIPSVQLAPVDDEYWDTHAEISQSTRPRTSVSRNRKTEFAFNEMMSRQRIAYALHQSAHKVEGVDIERADSLELTAGRFALLEFERFQAESIAQMAQQEMETMPAARSVGHV